MNDWTVPSVAEVDQLFVQAARLERRTYFFDRLENPEWVSPLAKRGFFSGAPDPEPGDEPGYVRFPPWPEGRYLARMAPLAPVAVGGVLKKLPPSANPWVTRALLECVQALPSEQFQELAPQTARWITSPASAPFIDLFADEAAAAVSRLLREGKLKQGLKAAKKLLSLKRSTGGFQNSTIDETLALLPEPVGLLSDWQYEEATKKILPDLVDSAGLKGLELFLWLLDVAVRFSRSEDEPSDSDAYSSFWRPAIEDHPQNSDIGVRCILVTAVRDAAVRLAGVSEEDLQKVVEILEAETVLHRRIALHVLTVVAGGSEMVAERIASRDLFEEFRLRHEYSELLRSRLGEAPPEARRTFLDWVAAGPDFDGFRRREEERTGSAPDLEDEAAYADRWKRDWLSIVAEHLSGDEVDEYRELVAKYGEAHHPDMLVWSESGFGDVAPLTADAMNEMSVGAVIEYLASWEPAADADWGFESSTRGLGRELEKAVSHRAADFAAVANRFETLDPTYVHSFLGGLEAAVESGASLRWEQPLRLMASVLEHPFEVEDDTLGRDLGWRWSRGQAASLIREAVADRDNRIPFELRQAAWNVLEPLTRDPNPTPAEEATAAGYSSMDPYTQSINTNRGKAMHAVMAYALWCRRELDARGIDTAAGFDLIPEVRTVLEEHLNPQNDSSLAVRAVYGKWLPWLILLDEHWVAVNITRILPRAVELADLRDSTWNTYIVWCPPFNEAYDALRREYEAAVERVPSEGTVDLAGDERADAKLGEHLVTFYWRGCLEAALLEHWFERADDELAARVMTFLGRVLDRTEDNINPRVLHRIQQIWDTRLEAIAQEPEAHQSEADAFAYTFASAKLDDDWSLEGLETTLRPGSPRWSGRPVLGRLAEIAENRPNEATWFTLRMLEGTVNDWDHLGWRDQVRDILAATDHVTDPEVIENRKAIVDHYIERGDHDFRVYIPSQP